MHNWAIVPKIGPSRPGFTSVLVLGQKSECKRSACNKRQSGRTMVILPHCARQA